MFRPPIKTGSQEPAFKHTNNAALKQLIVRGFVQ